MMTHQQPEAVALTCENRADHTASAARERFLFSLNETAEILGKSRSTIERALRRGMPCEQRADRDKRIEWRLHLGDCVQWLLKEARAGLLDDDPAGSARDQLVGEARDDLIFRLHDYFASSNGAARRAEIEGVRRALDKYEQLKAWAAGEA